MSTQCELPSVSRESDAPPSGSAVAGRPSECAVGAGARARGLAWKLELSTVGVPAPGEVARRASRPPSGATREEHWRRRACGLPAARGLKNRLKRISRFPLLPEDGTHRPRRSPRRLLSFSLLSNCFPGSVPAVARPSVARAKWRNYCFSGAKDNSKRWITRLVCR